MAHYAGFGHTSFDTLSSTTLELNTLALVQPKCVQPIWLMWQLQSQSRGGATLFYAQKVNRYQLFLPHRPGRCRATAPIPDRAELGAAGPSQLFWCQTLLHTGVSHSGINTCSLCMPASQRGTNIYREQVTRTRTAG